MKSKAYKSYTEACRKLHVGVTGIVKRHQTSILAVTGAVLLVGGLLDIANAQSGPGGTTPPATGTTILNVIIDDIPLRKAACALLGFVQGSFGALMMVASGIAAIMASAVGKYSAAMSLLVVGCGSFILESLITIFFPSLGCTDPAIGPKFAGKP